MPQTSRPVSAADRSGGHQTALHPRNVLIAACMDTCVRGCMDDARLSASHLCSRMRWSQSLTFFPPSPFAFSSALFSTLFSLLSFSPPLCCDYNGPVSHFYFSHLPESLLFAVLLRAGFLPVRPFLCSFPILFVHCFLPVSIVSLGVTFFP